MNKVTKTKIITCSLLGLASVSLFSVAFSAFIVTNDQLTVQNGDVTVSVGDVVDKSISISTIDVTDGEIAFEPKESDKTGPIIWDGNEEHSEDLDFTFTFTLTNVLTDTGEWGNRLGGVNIKWNEGNDGSFATCISNGYITAPKLGVDGSGAAITNTDAALFTVTSGGELTNSTGLTFERVDTTNVKVTVNYAFGWGAKFGGINPAEYATNENYTTVMSDITAFKSALTSTNFTITIDAFLAE